MKRTTRGKRVQDPAERGFVEGVVPETSADGQASRSRPLEEQEQDVLDQASLFEEGTEQDAYVRCYRRDEKSAAWVLHARFAPDEGTIEKIAELWGGGRYRVQLCAPDPDRAGRIKTLRTREVRVPGTYRPPRDVYGLSPYDMHADRRTFGAPEAAPPTRETLREVLDSAMLTKVLDLMKEGRASATDWTPLLATVGAIATTLVEKLFTQREDPARLQLLAQLKDVQDEMRALRQAPPTAAANAMKEALDMVQKVLEVKEMLPGKEHDDPETMLYQLGMKAFDALSGGQPGAVPGTTAEPRQVPASTSTGAEPPWSVLLRAHAGQLVMAARLNLSPYTVTELASKLRPEHQGVLAEFVQRETAVQDLARAVPPLAQFPTWCEAVLVALREAMEEDGGIEDATTGEEEPDGGSH